MLGERVLLGGVAVRGFLGGRVNVALATPCHGQLEPLFVVSLLDTIPILRDRGHEATRGYLSSSS